MTAERGCILSIDTCQHVIYTYAVFHHSEGFRDVQNDNGSVLESLAATGSRSLSSVVIAVSLVRALLVRRQRSMPILKLHKYSLKTRRDRGSVVR